MATPVIMPKMEMSQEAATVVQWLKREGDPVERGEPLLIIETDKVTMEVEAPASGVLAGIRAEPNQVVTVTEVIAYILQPGEELPQTISSVPQPTLDSPIPPPASALSTRPPGGTPAFEPPPGRVRATPAARRIAIEQEVDLAALRGSGPRGRVQAADVLAFSPAPAAPPQLAPEIIPLQGIRRTIAERMSASATATARVTLVTEVDATAITEARTQLKASVSDEWGFAPGYNDLLGLVVARALGEFPYMNARLSADDHSIERLPYVNLGMAVDTERGLLVPVIPDAGQKGLRAFGAEFRTLVERARAGKSLPGDLTGGTFTITNLGMYDVDAFTPIINLPEAAVLGAGRIQPKPMVRDGQVVVQQMWTLSLVFDHRLVDGAPAARFLQRIKQLIENPFLLLG
jgi:pyruvate dehydrogenase E2 component (dihydrolipoamide acetyltransferase)